jgi:hypothetical protein
MRRCHETSPCRHLPAQALPLLSEQIQQALFGAAEQEPRQDGRSHEGETRYQAGVGIMKPSTPHHLFAGVARAMADTPKREPKIVTRYDPLPIPWRGADWTATYGDYDLGDPVGTGATEAEAIADLHMEKELHDN